MKGDVNGSANIVRKAVSSALAKGITVGHTGTWIDDPKASGDLAYTLAGVILSGQAESINEESHRMTA